MELMQHLGDMQQIWRHVLEGMRRLIRQTQIHALIEKELSEETTALLSCLNAKDQELFYRIYGNEESPEQVSSELGITRNNLYVRLLRGKKKMRAYAAKREG